MQLLISACAAELFQVSSQRLLLCCKSLPRYESQSCIVASSNLWGCHTQNARQLQVAYNSSQLRLEDILESVRDAGFDADLLSSKSAEPSAKASVHVL